MPSKFAGGDPEYLRASQYRDSSKLAARGSLHEKYGTAALPWFDFVGARLDLTDPADVRAYLCSTPPGEDADDDQLSRITAAIDRPFDAGGGKMTITKDVGCFVAGGPLPV